jgi:hypothetical protein
VRGFYCRKFKNKIHQKPKYLNTDNLEAAAWKIIAIIATSQIAACSITDGVNGISYRHNSPSSTMTMRSNYALKEMNTRNTSLWVNVTNAYSWKPWHLHVLQSGSLTFLEPTGNVQACTAITSPLICVPNCFISFNCSLETPPSFKYKQSVLQ